MTNCQVRLLTASDDEAADDFVSRHANGTPFHLSAWRRSIEQTFRYQPVYLAAETGGKIRGVLPLFCVRNLLTGKALISSPFAVYGGIVADGEMVRQALAHEAGLLAARMRADYLELRNHSAAQCAGHSPVDRYATFSCPITPDGEALFAAIPRKTRYMVRKSLQQGFSLEFNSQNIKPFYDLYSQNLRRLGTPCFPQNHFRNLMENFGPNCRIAEVHLNGKVVAAVMTLYFRDRVLPYYGAADPAYNNSAPSTYMYYELMCRSAQEGFTVFDFGRSKKNCGSFDFKAHWGMQETDLPYEILLVRRRELPNYSPKNPKFDTAMRIWKRLPLPLTRALGPSLVRLVP